jgi:hypothetical protein
VVHLDEAHTLAREPPRSSVVAGSQYHDLADSRADRIYDEPIVETRSGRDPRKHRIADGASQVGKRAEDYPLRPGDEAVRVDIVKRSEASQMGSDHRDVLC